MCDAAQNIIEVYENGGDSKDLIKNIREGTQALLRSGNDIANITNNDKLKSFGFGLGAAVLGYVAAYMAATDVDGMTDDDRDELVKSVITLAGEFVKFIAPSLTIKVDLISAALIAVYMGSVQWDKSLEQYGSDGFITLTDLVYARIDSITVGMYEFNHKISYGLDDSFFNMLGVTNTNAQYDNMNYAEKANEKLKSLTDKTRNLAINVGVGVYSWLNKLTNAFKNISKGVSIQGDANNNLIMGENKNDCLYGGAGDDNIYGYSGNDKIYGENGNDVLYGGIAEGLTFNKADLPKATAVTIDSAYDIDIYSAGYSSLVTITASIRTNAIELVGNAKNNRIIGGSGSDILNGGTGSIKLQKAKGKEVTIEYSNGTFGKYLNGNLTSSGTVSKIPADALKYNGHSYYIFSNVVDTWEKAQAYCKSLGGYLAVINDATENTMLFNYKNSLGYGNVYFGLSDSAQEGTWAWVNGDSVNYTNWANGEPNGGKYENYGMFYKDFKESFWNDGGFDYDVRQHTANFLCEWENDLASSADIFEDDNFIGAEIDSLIDRNSVGDVSLGYSCKNFAQDTTALVNNQIDIRAEISYYHGK